MEYFDQIEELQSSDGTITGDYETFVGLIKGAETALNAAASAMALVTILLGPAVTPGLVTAGSLKASAEAIWAIGDGVQDILSDLRHAFPQ